MDTPRVAEDTAAPSVSLARLGGFGLLLLVALAVRLALLPVPGHNGDVLVMHRWADDLASGGPWTFFDRTISVYPALLYLLWPLGSVLHGDLLDTVIKGLSIPFDLLVGVAIGLVTLRLASPTAAFWAAALYLLNPAVLLAGPVWGQIDAAGTLAMLVSLAAAAGRRHGLAGFLGGLAALLKPQFGLVLLPVLVAATAEGIRSRRWQPPVLAAGGALLAYAVVAIPLRLDPFRYVEQLGQVTNILPDGSLYALNPWGLLLGFNTPEQGYGPLGLVLFAAGLLLSVLPVIRRADLATLLASGTFVVFAFYFLPTRSHERYLFPAMALMAPLAVLSLPRLVTYLGATLAFSAGMLLALVAITPFSLPPAIEQPLQTPFAIWTMAIALMAYAAAWVVMTWRLPWPPPEARPTPQRIASGS